MSLMRFVRDPQTAVEDFLKGLKLANPSLTVDLAKRIVINNQICKNQVCLLSGGGSGHEPFAAGFVGNGMSSGAVAGLVFASPPTHTILDAICTLAKMNNNNGVLLVHLNYTGDILNFGFAVEYARTLHRINIEYVVLDDDCSRSGDQLSAAGKRGMGGVGFALKICGSMAVKGESVKKVADEMRLINTKMATIGCAVTACTLPGQKPLFEIAEDEIEFGVGIHGEAGVHRMKLMPLEELVEKMLSQIIATLHLSSKNRVCVIINNLCSVSNLEMGIISSTVAENLAKKNMEVLRLYWGLLTTSLDMAGFQISLLNITDNEYWLEYLDSETSAPGWCGTFHSAPLSDTSCAVQVSDCSREQISKVGPKFTADEQALFVKCLKAMSNDIIKEESKLNELDSKTGDGDSGSTLRRLGEAILQKITSFELEYPAVTFTQLANISQEVMGGVTGALYGILLTAASKAIIAETAVDWLEVFSKSINTLLKYSKAKVGDRTMVDALVPAFEEFSKQVKNNQNVENACEAALQVAKKKTEETKHMKARVGRASYVPDEYITDVDPGAYAVTIWLNAICRTIHQSSK